MKTEDLIDKLKDAQRAYRAFAWLSGFTGDQEEQRKALFLTARVNLLGNSVDGYEEAMSFLAEGFRKSLPEAAERARDAAAGVIKDAAAACREMAEQLDSL